MKHLNKVLHIVFSLYGFLVFLILLFIVFPLVAIASLFGSIRGGNAIYTICTVWADIAMFFWIMPHRNYYEAPHNPGHPVIFVFNHISYIDIPIMLKAFRGQHIRILAKAEMAKIPVFGYIYRKAAILVERGSSLARARSMAKLTATLEKNISVVIAPEGTFNTTHKPLKEFYDGAFRLAIETGTSIKPVIFPDAYNRLNYKSIFTLTPGRSRAIFLPEVQVKGLTSQDMTRLKQQVYQEMEEALVRYKASWIHD